MCGLLHRLVLTFQARISIKARVWGLELRFLYHWPGLRCSWSDRIPSLSFRPKALACLVISSCRWQGRNARRYHHSWWNTQVGLFLLDWSLSLLRPPQLAWPLVLFLTEEHRFCRCKPTLFPLLCQKLGRTWWIWRNLWCWWRCLASLLFLYRFANRQHRCSWHRLSESCIFYSLFSLVTSSLKGLWSFVWVICFTQPWRWSFWLSVPLWVVSLISFFWIIDLLLGCHFAAILSTPVSPLYFFITLQSLSLYSSASRSFPSPLRSFLRRFGWYQAQVASALPRQRATTSLPQPLLSSALFWSPRSKHFFAVPKLWTYWSPSRVVCIPSSSATTLLPFSQGPPSKNSPSNYQVSPYSLQESLWWATCHLPLSQPSWPTLRSLPFPSSLYITLPLLFHNRLRIFHLHGLDFLLDVLYLGEYFVFLGLQRVQFLAIEGDMEDWPLFCWFFHLFVDEWANWLR